jgi:hypothetical protein
MIGVRYIKGNRFFGENGMPIYLGQERPATQTGNHMPEADAASPAIESTAHASKKAVGGDNRGADIEAAQILLSLPPPVELDSTRTSAVPTTTTDDDDESSLDGCPGPYTMDNELYPLPVTDEEWQQTNGDEPRPPSPERRELPQLTDPEEFERYFATLRKAGASSEELAAALAIAHETLVQWQKEHYQISRKLYEYQHPEYISVEEETERQKAGTFRGLRHPAPPVNPFTLNIGENDKATLLSYHIGAKPQEFINRERKQQQLEGLVYGYEYRENRLYAGDGQRPELQRPDTDKRDSRTRSQKKAEDPEEQFVPGHYKSDPNKKPDPYYSKTVYPGKNQAFKAQIEQLEKAQDESLQPWRQERDAALEAERSKQAMERAQQEQQEAAQNLLDMQLTSEILTAANSATQSALTSAVPSDAEDGAFQPKSKLKGRGGRKRKVADPATAEELMVETPLEVDETPADTPAPTPRKSTGKGKGKQVAIDVESSDDEERAKLDKAKKVRDRSEGAKLGWARRKAKEAAERGGESTPATTEAQNTPESTVPPEGSARKAKAARAMQEATAEASDATSTATGSKKVPRLGTKKNPEIVRLPDGTIEKRYSKSTQHMMARWAAKSEAKAKGLKDVPRIGRYKKVDREKFAKEKSGADDDVVSGDQVDRQDDHEGDSTEAEVEDEDGNYVDHSLGAAKGSNTAKTDRDFNENATIDAGRSSNFRVFSDGRPPNRDIANAMAEVSEASSYWSESEISENLLDPRAPDRPRTYIKKLKKPKATFISSNKRPATETAENPKVKVAKTTGDTNGKNDIAIDATINPLLQDHGQRHLRTSSRLRADRHMSAPPSGAAVNQDFSAKDKEHNGISTAKSANEKRKALPDPQDTKTKQLTAPISEDLAVNSGSIATNKRKRKAPTEVQDEASRPSANQRPTRSATSRTKAVVNTVKVPEENSDSGVATVPGVGKSTKKRAASELKAVSQSTEDLKLVPLVPAKPAYTKRKASEDPVGTEASATKKAKPSAAPQKRKALEDPVEAEAPAMRKAKPSAAPNKRKALDTIAEEDEGTAESCGPPAKKIRTTSKRNGDAATGTSKAVPAAKKTTSTSRASSRAGSRAPTRAASRAGSRAPSRATSEAVVVENEVAAVPTASTPAEQADELKVAKTLTSTRGGKRKTSVSKRRVKTEPIVAAENVNIAEPAETGPAIDGGQNGGSEAASNVSATGRPVRARKPVRKYEG